MQPRKLPIQSNHVPFNLYAKRSIEHIVILIDRIDGLRYGTSAIRLYAFPGNFQARIEPGKIYLVSLWHPLSLAASSLASPSDDFDVSLQQTFYFSISRFIARSPRPPCDAPFHAVPRCVLSDSFVKINTWASRFAGAFNITTTRLFAITYY